MVACNIWAIMLIAMMLSTMQSLNMDAKVASGGKNRITFAGLRLREPLASSIQSLKLTEATPIQDLAIRPLYTKLSAFVTAETGSGKTFTYLIPVLNAMFGREQTKQLSSLIVVPTIELANQVKNNIDMLLGYKYDALSSIIEKPEDIKDIKPEPLKDQIVISRLETALMLLVDSPRSLFRKDLALIMDEVDSCVAKDAPANTRNMRMRSNSRENKNPKGRFSSIVKHERFFDEKEKNNKFEMFDNFMKRLISRAADCQMIFVTATSSRDVKRRANRWFLELCEKKLAVAREQGIELQLAQDDLINYCIESTREDNLEHSRQILAPDAIVHHLVFNVGLVSETHKVNRTRLEKEISKRENIEDRIKTLNRICGEHKAKFIHPDLVKRAKVVRSKAEIVWSLVDKHVELNGTCRCLVIADSRTDAKIFTKYLSFRDDAVISAYDASMGSMTTTKGDDKDVQKVISARLKAINPFVHDQSGNDKGPSNSKQSNKPKIFVIGKEFVRGLDIPDLDIVIMTNPSADQNEYVHVAGRVARHTLPSKASDKKKERTYDVYTIINPTEYRKMRSWESTLCVNFQVEPFPLPERLQRVTGNDNGNDIDNEGDSESDVDNKRYYRQETDYDEDCEEDCDKEDDSEDIEYDEYDESD